jgi:hypothetical protein
MKIIRLAKIIKFTQNLKRSIVIPELSNLNIGDIYFHKIKSRLNIEDKERKQTKKRSATQKSFKKTTTVMSIGPNKNTGIIKLIF